MTPNDPSDPSSKWVKPEGWKSPLDDMIDNARAGRLAPRKDPRGLPPATYIPEPPKKSAAEWARDVARGFKNSGSYVTAVSSVYAVDSRTMLPDEKTANDVAAILDKIVIRDIAQRFRLHPDSIVRDIKSSTAPSKDGVKFSYKSYDMGLLQNIRWDVIIANIKDQSPGGPAGGRS